MCVLFVTASGGPGSAAAAGRFACNGRGAVAGADLHLQFHKMSHNVTPSLFLPPFPSRSLSRFHSSCRNLCEVEQRRVTPGVAGPSAPYKSFTQTATWVVVGITVRTDGANCGHVVVRFVAGFQKGHRRKFVCLPRAPHLSFSHVRKNLSSAEKPA